MGEIRIFVLREKFSFSSSHEYTLGTAPKGCFQLLKHKFPSATPVLEMISALIPLGTPKK